MKWDTLKLYYGPLKVKKKRYLDSLKRYLLQNMFKILPAIHVSAVTSDECQVFF